MILYNLTIEESREQRAEREKKMMNKSFIVAVFMLCVVCSSHLESAAAQVSCYDSCSTGCVNQDQRLAARCDRKCSIKCGPAGAKVEEKRLG